RALGDTGARECRLAVVKARLVGRTTLGTAPCLAIDCLRRLDHTRHEYARQVDELGRNFTGLDDLVDFDNCNARSLCEAWIEVLTATPKLHIAKAVGAVSPEKCIVHMNRMFED